MSSSSLRRPLAAWIAPAIVSVVALTACGKLADEDGLSGFGNNLGASGQAGGPGAGGGVASGGTGAGAGSPGGRSGGAGQSGSPGASGQDGGLALQPALVSVTIYHACAVVEGGRVKCWGVNSAGQLGLGDTEWRGDQLADMGEALPFVDLGTDVTAAGVAVLGQSSCALLTDGRVKCWGGGVFGDQPGEMGDNLPFVRFGTGAQVVQLVAGEDSICGLLASGEVKCWGQNTFGQLGLGAVPSWGTTQAEMGDNLPAVDLGTGLTVKSLAAGRVHTCVLFTDGRVKCWGANGGGRLGLGDSETRGDQDGEMGDALPFVDLGTGVKATAVAASYDATCALLDDGRVKCWGSNYSGQLGLGPVLSWGDQPGQMGDALPAVDLGTTVKVASLAAGTGNHCAVFEDGRLKCWGSNSQGQLGLGNTESRGDEPGEMGDALPYVKLGTGLEVASVHGGVAASWCARMTNRKVKCWGDNFNSHLGLGDSYPRGTLAGHMGNALPFIDLGVLVGP